MVWVDESGRLPMCEAGTSGFLARVPVTVSTINGFVITPPIRTTVCSINGWVKM